MARTAAVIVLAAVGSGLAPAARAHADAALSSPGDAVAEASHVVRVGLGWPLATVEMEQVLINRSAGASLAAYQFDLPADAVITGLAVEPGKGGAVRGHALDADAARRPLADPPAAAVPDLALLHMISDATRPRPDARARYELRLYPVPAGRSVKVTVTAIVPVTYRDDRLAIRWPARGAAAGLVRERVGATIVPGADLASGRELRVAGTLAAGARGVEVDALTGADLVIEARPRWKRSTPFARVASVALGKDEPDAVVVAVAVPATPPRDLTEFERIVVVVDGSLSMGPEGHALAARITRRLLERASTTARIEVVPFARTATGLLGGFRDNASASRTAVADGLARLVPAAGSDLGLALDHVGRLLARTDGAAAATAGAAGHGDRSTTLIAIITDGLVPSELDARSAIDQLGRTVVGRAMVAPIVLVPAGAGLPAVADGLEGLAAASSGRVLFVRHDEADRADRLFDELGTPPPLEDLALADGDGAVAVDLPGQLDRGQGAVVVGQARPRALALSARQAGQAVDLALARDPMLSRRAAALYLGHDAPVDPDRARQLTEAAGVVSPSTALVAFAPDDGFGRDRLALARKWGSTSYGRVAPPTEESLPRLVRQAGTTDEAPGRATGTLDKQIVGTLLASQLRPRARACYQDALRRAPELAGHLTVTLEMARGEVHFARVSGLDLSNPELRACVLDAAYAVKVPAVATGAASEARFVARYPLQFKVRDRRGEVDAVEPSPAKAPAAADPLGSFPEP